MKSFKNLLGWLRTSSLKKAQLGKKNKSYDNRRCMACLDQALLWGSAVAESAGQVKEMSSSTDLKIPWHTNLFVPFTMPHWCRRWQTTFEIPKKEERRKGKDTPTGPSGAWAYCRYRQVKYLCLAWRCLKTANLAAISRLCGCMWRVKASNAIV